MCACMHMSCMSTFIYLHRQAFARAWMHLRLYECECVYAQLCTCVCVRPVAGHPSGQVSGRIRASLQWPGGNLEEKRWITEPHWGSKTARLSLLLLKHTHTLMGTHLQPNTPPPPNTDTQTDTDSVIREWEKKGKKSSDTQDTKEWLQPEGGYYYYCWHNMRMHPHTQTHTHVQTESEKVTYKVRNTPTHTYDCVTESSVRHGAAERRTLTETCSKWTHQIISSLIELNTHTHSLSLQGLSVCVCLACILSVLDEENDHSSLHPSFSHS